MYILFQFLRAPEQQEWHLGQAGWSRQATASSALILPVDQLRQIQIRISFLGRSPKSLIREGITQESCGLKYLQEESDVWTQFSPISAARSNCPQNGRWWEAFWRECYSQLHSHCPGHHAGSGTEPVMSPGTRSLGGAGPEPGPLLSSPQRLTACWAWRELCAPFLGCCASLCIVNACVKAMNSIKVCKNEMLRCSHLLLSLSEP